MFRKCPAVFGLAAVLAWTASKTVLSAPHRLSPDRAQQAGKKPVVEAIGDKKALTDDGAHVIERYHLRNFPHHDGMIVACLPRKKVLLRIVPVHDPADNLVVTMAELTRWVGRPSS